MAAETKEATSSTSTPTLEDMAGAQGNGPIASIPKNNVHLVGKVPPEVWTRERIELIKKQICPAGITDDEFAVFLEKCKRSGLDPLMNECYCVPRSSKVKVADPTKIDRATGKPTITEKYVTQHVFQAAEHGMEVRAHRAGDFLGIRAGAIYEGDQCAIDFAEGRVVHRTNAAAPRGKLIGAWAIASRRGVEIQPVAHVLFTEYSQGQSQWLVKPETMIVKCARAAALRLAYPYEFAGVYTTEEMSSAIFVDEARDATPAQAAAPADAPPASSSKTDQLDELLKKRASKTTVDATPGPLVTPAPAAEASSSPPPPTYDQNRVILCTDGKRKPIEEASPLDLENAEKAGELALKDPKYTEEQKAKGVVKLEIIRAEIKRRADELAAAFGDETKTEPAGGEPGSAG